MFVFSWSCRFIMASRTTIVQQLSKENANFLRLAALVIDGGKYALKTQFDMKFPANTLAQDLRAPGNFQILQRLGNPPRGKRRILMQAQFDLLFPHLATPPSTKNVDSSDFDVTLLACLIQNLPAFHQINNPVWTQKGHPLCTDLSLAADVKRLRLERNEVRVFLYSLCSFTEAQFETRNESWKLKLSGN